jgi:anti-anti-sigma factor
MTSNAIAHTFKSLETGTFRTKWRKAPTQVTVINDGRAAIVQVSGDIDLYSSTKLRQVVLEAFDDPQVPRVILDFKGVNHLDSSGVATLVECLQRSRQSRRPLSLCDLKEAPRRVLELTRLSKVFEVFDNLGDALA